MKRYSDRYADNWHKIAARARRLTGNCCCYPGCRDAATEVHHAVYCDRAGAAIAGKEQPGVHIFPLCDRHHREAHWPRNWVIDPRSPELRNRNKPNFYKVLRRGWLARIERTFD